jgi:hypothetical protein
VGGNINTFVNLTDSTFMETCLARDIPMFWDDILWQEMGRPASERIQSWSAPSHLGTPENDAPATSEWSWGDHDTASRRSAISTSAQEYGWRFNLGMVHLCSQQAWTGHIWSRQFLGPYLAICEHQG